MHLHFINLLLKDAVFPFGVVSCQVGGNGGARDNLFIFLCLREMRVKLNRELSAGEGSGKTDISVRLFSP